MLPGGLDAIYGVETDEAADIALSADALANLHSLERLEERVAVILLDEKAKVRSCAMSRQPVLVFVRLYCYFCRCRSWLWTLVCM